MTEGICPSGWHIPSDGEFTELTDFLGVSVAGGKIIYNGTALIQAVGLVYQAGFYYWGGFGNVGGEGSWWSASESGSGSWLRALYYSYDDVGRHTHSPGTGYSARCVRD